MQLLLGRNEGRVSSYLPLESKTTSGRSSVRAGNAPVSPVVSVAQPLHLPSAGTSGRVSPRIGSGTGDVRDGGAQFFLQRVPSARAASVLQFKKVAVPNKTPLRR